MFSLGDIEHRISLSVGACVFHALNEPVDVLLKHAEIAMYQAKAAGRDTLRFYDSAMQAQANARATMGRELRTAVEDRQFVLHYQPQFDLESRLIGAEALLRWQHPTRGLVGPLDFIPFAEEEGLIIPIGHWVLNQACQRLAAWAGMPAFKGVCISVNISLKQFRQADFVDQVRGALATSGADASCLKLEITESLLAVDIADVIEKMLLQAEGVGFSLDDFGTGYSSLSYLKHLPLTEVKIDKSFVKDILHDTSDVAIAKMDVALADCMGLSVIAEGIESAAQRDMLAELGCHGFQGFWFSKPLDIDQFEQRFGR
ncbi:MAG: EAL domain-containing protein [Natronospirillum sp.]